MPRPPDHPRTTHPLERQLGRCLPADRASLRSRIRRLGRQAPTRKRTPPDSVSTIERAIADSERLWARRRETVPEITYPEDLPVAARRQEIADAIREHRVVVVCGETGSGKTTQLPKICLEIGRGVGRTIGHTQPRRIAARSVASRIAEELGVAHGTVVGSKVRFTDETRPDTLVKLMTDGIMLAETQTDRRLSRYDTIIIDEAHERSLNIDFLLGYLRELLPKRRDLKVIITSATIDPERFADHFAIDGTPAPIIEVSGRTYPVETRFRALSVGDERDGVDVYAGVADALTECWNEAPGDALIFMPGEREIRETAHTLRQWFQGDAAAEIVPLYARLSPQEQKRVFTRSRGRRAIIATNVAETSLTVPGIKYVIDPGTARISRYSARSKIQGLEIEPISQASANQRSGRCGRVGPGVCVRLYSREDFEGRDQFTPPEILRTNLASVVLRMSALRLGRPESFPFLDRPDSRLIRDGYSTLEELGAIDSGGDLTPIGREMSRLPIDPRISRMILAARDEGALRDVLIIASALAVQDPRDRPFEKRDDADRAHERFRDDRSDFLEYLNIWSFYHDQAKKLSRRQLDRACAQNFLSTRRLHEWREIYRQIRAMVTETVAQPTHDEAPYDAIHRSLLTGLLTSVGKKGEGNEYEGVRGSRFHIFPGSGQFGAKPKWLVSGEIVRTTRVYARTVAQIDPAWIEELGGDLLKKTYSDPGWDARSAQVMANERVTMLGLELVKGRRKHYGPVNPSEARELFIHHALVEGEYTPKSATLQNNAALADEVRSLEEKARRHDLLADAQARYDFYDRRLPGDVFSGQSLERWLKAAERDDPGVVRMTREDLLIGDEAVAAQDNYPEAMRVQGHEIPLRYRYQPGETDDGVTIEIPVERLGQVRSDDADWVVPGLREEKISALMRTLPKSLRRPFDIAVTARELASTLGPDDGPMLEALATALSTRGGLRIGASDFRPEELGEHLRLNVRVLDARGGALAEGRDIPELKRRLAGEIRSGFRAAGSDRFERTGLADWDFDDLPESVELSGEGGRKGGALRAFPALADIDGEVGLRLFDSPEAAADAMRAGLARLYVHHLRDEMRYRASHLPSYDAIRVLYTPLGSAEDLTRDLLLLIADRAFVDEDASVRTREQFASRIELGWNRLGPAADDACTLAHSILKLRTRVRAQLDESPPKGWRTAWDDMGMQLGWLVYPGFLSKTPWAWLQRQPRYLEGMLRRMEKLRSVGPDRDLGWARDVHRWWGRYTERRQKHEHEGIRDPELEWFRWMIEEYRVSLFAQELGTSVPVSPKRLESQWAKVRL